MHDDQQRPDAETEEHETNGSEVAETKAANADVAEDPESADLQAATLPASDQKAIAAKLELLVNVALLTIMTLMRIIKDRGPEAIGPAELKQFENVKESIEAAVAAVDSWQEMGEDEDSPIDLTKLRSKLAVLTRRIEEWPLDLVNLDSTPPS